MSPAFCLGMIDAVILINTVSIYQYLHQYLYYFHCDRHRYQSCTLDYHYDSPHDLDHHDHHDHDYRLDFPHPLFRVLSFSLGFVTILCHQTFSPRHSETEPSNHQGLITAIALSEDDVYAAVCVILNMPLGLVDVLKAESSDWFPGVEGLDFSWTLEVCCWCGLRVYWFLANVFLHAFCMLFAVNSSSNTLQYSFESWFLTTIYVCQDPYEWWRCHTVFSSCLIKECIDWFIPPKQACHRQWFFDPRLFFQHNWTLYQLPQTTPCFPEISHAQSGQIVTSARKVLLKNLNLTEFPRCVFRSCWNDLKQQKVASHPLFSQLTHHFPHNFSPKLAQLAFPRAKQKMGENFSGGEVLH